MVDLDIRWFPRVSPDPVQIQSAIGSITWRHCAGRGWTKTIVVSSLLFVVLTLGWGRNPASTPLSVSTHASLRNRNHTKNRASIYIYISLSSDLWQPCDSLSRVFPLRIARLLTCDWLGRAGRVPPGLLPFLFRPQGPREACRRSCRRRDGSCRGHSSTCSFSRAPRPDPAALPRR